MHAHATAALERLKDEPSLDLAEDLIEIATFLGQREQLGRGARRRSDDLVR